MKLGILVRYNDKSRVKFINWIVNLITHIMFWKSNNFIIAIYCLLHWIFIERVRVHKSVLGYGSDVSTPTVGVNLYWPCEGNSSY